MSQSKILIDSNSYFRLAKSIHPLLNEVFGELEYCLYVLKELEKEYDRNPRLKTKFHWVNEDEYFQNRKKKVNISNKEKKEIERTIGFLEGYKNDNCLGTSPIDIKYLATAFILDIPVVTDDIDMLNLGKAFDIVTMTSMDLLKLMLESDHINIEKVRETVSYWKYIKDIPANYKKNYKKLFKENAP